MSVDLNGIITWLKGWFYDKTEVTGFLNNKANVSDLQTTNSNLSALQSTVDNKVDKITGKGLSTEDYTSAEKTKLSGIEEGANKTVVDSSLSTTSTNPVQNKAIYNEFNNLDAQDINFADSYWTAFDNVSDALYDVQQKVNGLSGIKAIEVVSTLQTASSSTMGKLYIVSEDDKINVYYTEQNGSDYAWHKMDTDILDDLSIDWSEITNNPFSSSTPSDFADANHNHSYDEIFVGGGVYLPSYLTNTFALKSHSHDFGDIKNITWTDGTTTTTMNGGRFASTVNNLIYQREEKGNCITSIELVPKTEDDTGAIRLYYGDEE